MEKSRGILHSLAVALLAVAGVLLLVNVVAVLFFPMFGLRALALSVSSVCAPAFAGTALFFFSHKDEAERGRVVRAMLWSLFGFYLAGLIGTLFLSRISFSSYAADRAHYLEDWAMMTNFRPFDTILRYGRCILRGVIPSISRLNIIGNVLLLMPLALFLPALFLRLQAFWRYALLVLLLSLAIEGLQLLLCCGSCDVDDVILNLLGALPAFWMFRIPPIRRMLIRLHIFPAE